MKCIACRFLACNDNKSKGLESTKSITKMSDTGKATKTEDEWKKILSEEQFNILRNKGTERAFTGKYYLHKEKGIYVCAACGAELFSSDTKFDSGCGWPSFNDVLDSSKVVYTKDTTHRMVRTEITCAHCGGHLGHVFDDGPPPTGQRYCINSLSIGFKK